MQNRKVLDPNEFLLFANFKTTLLGSSGLDLAGESRFNKESIIQKKADFYRDIIFREHTCKTSHV